MSTEQGTLPVVDLLRLLVGDRVKPGQDPANAFFSDEELDQVLQMGGGELYWSASIAWGMKASEYARLIDMDESGSSRKLSQRHSQAVQMWEYYEQLAESVRSYTPPVGRSAGIYRHRGQPPERPVSYIVWNATTAFQPGTLVVYGQGTAYNCIVAVGPSATPPPSDPEHWQQAPLIPTDLSDMDTGVVLVDQHTWRFVPNYG